MVEPKVSLNMLVPGAGMLSSQVCEENPKESYNEEKVFLEFTKGKGKNKKKVKQVLTIHTRKPNLVSHVINICEEAYKYMLETPTSTKYLRKTNQGKTVWSVMSEHDRLKHHFDLIAYDFHAVSYSYEVLN